MISFKDYILNREKIDEGILDNIRYSFDKLALGKGGAVQKKQADVIDKFGSNYAKVYQPMDQAVTDMAPNNVPNANKIGKSWKDMSQSWGRMQSLANVQKIPVRNWASQGLPGPEALDVDMIDFSKKRKTP